MQKYIIFIDVDGTLIKSGTCNMSKVIADEFKRIKKEGHIVVIVTGRSLRDLNAVTRINSATYISGLMGGIVIDCETNKIVKEPPVLNSKDVKKFIDEIEKNNLIWTYKNYYEERTYYDPKLIGNPRCHEITREEYLVDLKNNEICQLLIEGELPQKIMDKFKMFDYYRMPGGYYDVIKKGFTKADIIREFMEKYPEYKSVAIGDSDNDLAMLKEANISIAMGNADDELKKKCDYVTEDYEHYGVVYAFRNILKI